MSEFDNKNGFDNGYENYRNNVSGSNYADYTYPKTAQTGQNEFSYQPNRHNRKNKKLLSAVLAVLFVAAISSSALFAISFMNGGENFRFLGEESSSDESSSGPSETSDAGVSAEDDSDTEPRSELPTLEQLAAPDDAMSIPDIVTKLSPSVVGISCITNGQSVSGTGIIMSGDGYIITNAHVVEDASAISVVITDSTESSDSVGDSSVTAELIGMDTQTDLAVLKIDKIGLTAAEFGISSDIQVGELAIVIGNPLGFDLANTVTSGIISATDRTLTIDDRTMNFIQTDASINSGNSGGPLINAYGQVIGITSAKVSSTYGEGLGFAIPIDDAKEIIDDLIEFGYVTGRPTLGISGSNISSFYAEYYGVPQGFIVKTVSSGSAAEEAGIQVGDLIIGIEGETITSIEEFNEIKSGYKAGDEITVMVYRNDNIVDISVVLDEANDDASDEEQSDSDSQSGGFGGSDGGLYDDYQDFYDYYRQNFVQTPR